MGTTATVRPVYPEGGFSLGSLRSYLHLLEGIGYVPHVHGDGFIQIDLNHASRLHVWGDVRIPRQRVKTPIHDHTFSFTSYVLRGRLVNVTYQESLFPGMIEAVGLPVGTFYEPKARQGEDTILVSRGTGRYGLFTLDAQLVNAGDLYCVDHGVLHETITPEVCVTVMVKHDSMGAGAKPRVFVPDGHQPDNDFHRYRAASPAELWQIVNDALG